MLKFAATSLTLKSLVGEEQFLAIYFICLFSRDGRGQMEALNSHLEGSQENAMDEDVPAAQKRLRAELMNDDKKMSRNRIKKVFTYT